MPAEQDEDEDEDLRLSDEWGLVDESKQNTDEPSQTNSYFDMLSNASTQISLQKFLTINCMN